MSNMFSDPDKREVYDEFGEQGIKEGGGGKGGGGFTSPMDMFNMMFNGMPGRVYLPHGHPST